MRGSPKRLNDLQNSIRSIHSYSATDDAKGDSMRLYSDSFNELEDEDYLEYNKTPNKIEMSAPLAPSTPFRVKMTKYLLLTTKCLGELYGDRISFKLSPCVSKIFCQFDFYPMPEQVFTLMMGPLFQPTEVEINGIKITFDGIDMDITKYMINGNNHFVFTTKDMRQVTVASVSWKLTDNIDVLVKMIMQKMPTRVLYMNQPYSNICPITNNPIEVPVRAESCEHMQAFDARAYLEKAIASNVWVCPICSKRALKEDLRYDPEYFARCGSDGINDDLDFY